MGKKKSSAILIVLLTLLAQIATYQIPAAQGIAWSDKTSLTPSLTLETKPYVTMDAQGKLWLAYETYRSNNWDIFGRIFDGTAWLQEERYTNHGSKDLNPSLALLANSSLLMVWASDRSGEFKLYSKTYNPTWGWSAENPVTSGPGRDSTPSLLQSTNGVLWLFWTREALSGQTVVRDIYYKTYTNGVWSSDTPFASSTASELQPSVAETHDGAVWVAYASSLAGNLDIYYRTFRGSWSTQAPLTTSGDDDRQPWIMQDLNGTVWVFWTRCVASGQFCQDDIFYKTSSSLGASWSSEVQFTIDPQGVEVFDGEPAAVHLQDKRIYLLYVTNATGDGGDFDVYYSRSDPIPIHNVAISSLAMPENWPRQGEAFDVTVRVENRGDYTESTALAVTVDGASLGSASPVLSPGQSAAFSFSWASAGKPIGPHDLQASLSQVQGEVRTSDNSVSTRFFVLSAGDVQRDGVVNILDLVLVGGSFLSKPWDPRYNPQADINKDGNINILDLVIIGSKFGEKVILPPGFIVGASIYYLRAELGSAPRVNISVTSISGFTSPVLLSAAGFGGGITASFAPNPVAPTGTSVLTLNVSPTATAGRYTITIKATSGSITHTANIETCILYRGDVNNDGVVNILDLVRVGSAFLKTSGTPGYDPEADINKDGVINILDLVIVGSEFLKSC